MIRYRCPHCAALIVAHERRVGQSSVCKGCVTPHTIPADQALWLNERGEALPLPAAPVVVASPPEPIPAPAPVVSAESEPDPPALSVVPVPDPAPPAVAALGDHAPSMSGFVPPATLDADRPPAERHHAPSMSDFVLPDEPAELTRTEPPAPQATPVAVAVREPEPIPVEAPVVRDEEPRVEVKPQRFVRESPPEPVEVPEPVRVSPPAPIPQRLAALVSPVEFADEATPAPSAVVTLTPPPAPAPAVTPVPRGPVRSSPVPVAVRDSDSGYVEPVQLQTQADIAVALTAALTSRMKPPAAPRRDLRPSTAAWMLLTAVGVSLLVLALFTDSAYRWPALVIGAVQIAIGYVWIVRLTRFRDPTRGLLCAIPPLTLYYLTQYKYAKLRPLRFVATGAVIVALAVWTALVAPHTQALVRGPEPAAPPNPAAMSKLEQLRAHRDQRSYDALSKLLDVLAKTDPLLSEDAKDRAQLAVELKALCQHADVGVKVRAMAAYARWDPAGAQEVCLAAVRSTSAEEREWALRLLPQWKDAKSARAVQALIGRPGAETNRAKAALEEIGGEPAEQATLALLNRAEDQGTKLTALTILEKVGGVGTAAWLRTSYAGATDDPAVRDRALSAADAIGARLRTPTPAQNP